MSPSITDVLTEDHVRLGKLLDRAETGDPAAYDAFRGGLLRHIGIEEKVLLPLLRDANCTHASADQLRRDHAALVAMLVPPPSLALLGRIRTLLALHDPWEELEAGLHRLADRNLDVPAVVERIRLAPTPPLAPNNASARAFAVIEMLTERAERNLGP